MEMKTLIRYRNNHSYLEEDHADPAEKSILVNITLYRVPSDLVREFALRVAVSYPGGLSEALQDLMRRALKN